MDKWLKILIAVTAILVTIATSIWIYDRYQLHTLEEEMARKAGELIKLKECADEVKQTIPGSKNAEHALSCSEKYPELNWFKETHFKKIAEAEAITKHQQMITQLKEAYSLKEKNTDNDADKYCFTNIRTLYQTGGKDVLYTTSPSDPKIMAVKDCISRNVFSEAEVKAVITQ